MPFDSQFAQGKQNCRIIGTQYQYYWVLNTSVLHWQ